MNDLQKDQAIYNEMLRIANEVFDNAIEKNEGLRDYMNKNAGVVTLNDITAARSDVYPMISATPSVGDNGGMYDITVGTFTCSFPAMRVFDLLKYWKSLAKAKGDILFTYEEQIEREFIGSVEITIENPANAKMLANSLGDDDLRPIMNNVLLEVNATSGDINFVACDGHELAVISNSPATICTPHADEDRVFQALFTKADWKRICDYAKKQKSSVTFEIYAKGVDADGCNECQDTMVAVLGDTRVKSIIEYCLYPKWKSVLPELDTMRHFTLAAEDVPLAQQWLSKVKAHDIYDSVAVSVYQGSDIIYFDTENGTNTFRLSRPSECTMGARLAIRRLQKKKFSGFYIPKFGGGTIIDDANNDFMLLMPVDGESPIRNIEDREIHLEEMLEVCETAMEVELQAA